MKVRDLLNKTTFPDASGFRNRVLFGDAYAVLSSLAGDFVDCTVTSPPYWLQRSYLPDAHKLKVFEMGSERTLPEYIAGMAEVFSQVYRVTKPGGVLWLNVGDKVAGRDTAKLAPGYADGELMGIPWMLSDAIRQKGWRRAGEVIWSKPNPMTTGHARAPMTSHEHVFMFAKGDGYYDPMGAADACKYPAKKKVRSNHFDSRVNGHNPPAVTVSGDTKKPRSVWEIPVGSANCKKLLADIREDGEYLELSDDCPVHGKNPSVSPGPLFGEGPPVACSCVPVSLEHFAAMPERLAERCILLSTSEVGCCPETGRPWRRLVHKERIATRPGTAAAIDPSGKSNRDPRRHVTSAMTIGWQSPEGGSLKRPAPCVVLDPFGGKGTTAAVARSLGRDYVTIELNPAYAKRLIPARIDMGYERTYRP